MREAPSAAEEQSVFASTPLFRRHAPRPRLTSVLDETRAQAILLTAPAGYGKTTLAQEWLQGREHVAWYRATPASADLAAFSTGLVDVIAPLVPSAGQRLRQRVRLGDPQEATRPLAELLANDLVNWPEDGMIVIDDYHLVADSAPVEEFIDWLLTLVKVRILVTTRGRPAWASARRLLYGEILEIGPDQLAMTDEEAGRVLEGRSSEAVRTVVRQARGWPALIGLAALTASLELPEERMSDALFRYFAEEVFRREPADVQRFMLLASIPPRVNSQIAREVLGIEHPEPIVERLRSEDLMHADMNGDLRFHPLLRDFLRRRFASEDESRYRNLSLRAVSDARAKEQWDEAFELAIDIGELDEAAEIVGEASTELLATGRIETLEKWLSLAMPASLERPSAGLARAALLIHKGQVSEAVSLANEIASSLPDDAEDAAYAWSLAGRGLHLLSRDAEAQSSYRRSLAASTKAEERREALWGLFLSASEVDPDQSTKYLGELEALADGDIDTRLRLAVGHQFAAEQRGTLAGLWSRYEALLPAVDHAANPLARSSFLANAAGTQVGRGHYREANELASRALALCRELSLDFAVGACLAFRAAAEIGLRQFRSAEATLREFQRTSSKREDPFLQMLELSLRAKLAASTRSLAEALEVRELAPVDVLSPRGHGEFLATLSIIAAALGEDVLSRQLVHEARDLSRSVETVHCTSFAETILEVNEGEGSGSRSKAEEAIVAADHADFRDGLVLTYRVFPHLLRLVTDPVAIAALRRSLTLSRDHHLARAAGLDVYEAPLSAGLFTPREREVLQLMRRGLSNAEIATSLVISPSTAKAHVHHILEKLGVRSRVKAILRADEILGEES
jgi:LuxR family maltose regulon positive regulatory protein